MSAARRRSHRPPFGVLLLFYGALAFVALELRSRIFWLKQLIPSAGIEEPHFHHRLKPHTEYPFTSSEFNVTVRTNSYGLRGHDPVLPKPPGVFRILMMGDSYIFGFPVKDDETSSVLIEQTLRSQGYPVEVINAGVSGYSPTLHYLSLRDQFLSFEPDLVILWYDLGDLMEDHTFQKNLIYDTQGRIVACNPRYINGRFSVWKWLQDHSVFMKWIHTKVVRTVDKMRILGAREYLALALRGERAKVAIAKLKRQQRAPDLAANDRFLLVREDSTPELIQPYWELSATYLRMIRDLLKARKIPLVLGVYPYGIVVGPDQWAEGRTYWGFEKGKTYRADAFLDTITRFAQAEHMPFLNTFDSFKQAAATEKLFYDWDGHFTPAGQRVLAAHVCSDRRVLAFLKPLLRQPR